MKYFLRYLLNVAIWLDIGVNTIVFAGSPYETISSRLGKRVDKGDKWACVVCAWLSKLLGPAHCKNSEVPDYGETLPNWWKNL